MPDGSKNYFVNYTITANAENAVRTLQQLKTSVENLTVNQSGLKNVENSLTQIASAMRSMKEYALFEPRIDVSKFESDLRKMMVTVRDAAVKMQTLLYRGLSGSPIGTKIEEKAAKEAFSGTKTIKEVEDEIKRYNTELARLSGTQKKIQVGDKVKRIKESIGEIKSAKNLYDQLDAKVKASKTPEELDKALKDKNAALKNLETLRNQAKSYDGLRRVAIRQLEVMKKTQENEGKIMAKADRAADKLIKKKQAIAKAEKDIPKETSVTPETIKTWKKAFGDAKSKSLTIKIKGDASEAYKAINQVLEALRPLKTPINISVSPVLDPEASNALRQQINAITRPINTLVGGSNKKSKESSSKSGFVSPLSDDEKTKLKNAQALLKQHKEIQDRLQKNTSVQNPTKQIKGQITKDTKWLNANATNVTSALKTVNTLENKIASSTLNKGEFESYKNAGNYVKQYEKRLADFNRLKSSTAGTPDTEAAKQIARDGAYLDKYKGKYTAAKNERAALWERAKSKVTPEAIASASKGQPLTVDIIGNLSKINVPESVKSLSIPVNVKVSQAQITESLKAISTPALTVKAAFSAAQVKEAFSKIPQPTLKVKAVLNKEGIKEQTKGLTQTGGKKGAKSAAQSIEINAKLNASGLAEQIKAIKVPTITLPIKLGWAKGAIDKQAQMKALQEKMPKIDLMLNTTKAQEQLNAFIASNKGKTLSINLTATPTATAAKSAANTAKATATASTVSAATTAKKTATAGAGAAANATKAATAASSGPAAATNAQPQSQSSGVKNNGTRTAIRPKQKPFFEGARAWAYPFTGNTSFGAQTPMAVDMAKGMGVMFAVGGAMQAVSSSLQEAVEYQNTMRTTNAILKRSTDTYSDKGFKQMEKTVRDVGNETKFTAPQVASAARFLAMAGYDINAINKSIRPIADLALIGDTDLGETADKMTNIMSTFNIKPEQMRGAANVMTNTAIRSNTDLMMLAESAKYGGGVAYMYGHNDKNLFADTMALFGIMGNSGIQGSSAGTALRMMYQNIFKPNKGQAYALKKLQDKYGIKAKDKNGSYRSMAEIILEIAQKVPKNSMGNLVGNLFRITAQPGANAAIMGAAQKDNTDPKEVAAGLNSIGDFIDKHGFSALANLIQTNRASVNGTVSNDIAGEKKVTIAGLWAQVTSMFTEGILRAFENKQQYFEKILTQLNDYLAKPETMKMIQDLFDMIISIGESMAWFVKQWVNIYNAVPGLVKAWIVTQMFFTQMGTLISPVVSLIGVFARFKSLITGFGAALDGFIDSRTARMVTGNSASSAANAAAGVVPPVSGPGGGGPSGGAGGASGMGATAGTKPTGSMGASSVAPVINTGTAGAASTTAAARATKSGTTTGAKAVQSNANHLAGNAIANSTSSAIMFPGTGIPNNKTLAQRRLSSTVRNAQNPNGISALRREQAYRRKAAARVGFGKFRHTMGRYITSQRMPNSLPQYTGAGKRGVVASMSYSKQAKEWEDALMLSLSNIFGMKLTDFSKNEALHRVEVSGLSKFGEHAKLSVMLANRDRYLRYAQEAQEGIKVSPYRLSYAPSLADSGIMQGRSAIKKPYTAPATVYIDMTSKKDLLSQAGEKSAAAGARAVGASASRAVGSSGSNAIDAATNAAITASLFSSRPRKRRASAYSSLIEAGYSRTQLDSDNKLKEILEKERGQKGVGLASKYRDYRRLAEAAEDSQKARAYRYKLARAQSIFGGNGLKLWGKFKMGRIAGALDSAAIVASLKGIGGLFKSLIGGMAKALGLLTSPISLIIGAVGILGFASYKFYKWATGTLDSQIEDRTKRLANQKTASQKRLEASKTIEKSLPSHGLLPDIPLNLGNTDTSSSDGDGTPKTKRERWIAQGKRNGKYKDILYSPLNGNSTYEDIQKSVDNWYKSTNSPTNLLAVDEETSKVLNPNNIKKRIDDIDKNIEVNSQYGANAAYSAYMGASFRRPSIAKEVANAQKTQMLMIEGAQSPEVQRARQHIIDLRKKFLDKKISEKDFRSTSLAIMKGAVNPSAHGLKDEADFSEEEIAKDPDFRHYHGYQQGGYNLLMAEIKGKAGSETGRLNALNALRSGAESFTKTWWDAISKLVTNYQQTYRITENGVEKTAQYFIQTLPDGRLNFAGIAAQIQEKIKNFKGSLADFASMASNIYIQLMELGLVGKNYGDIQKFVKEQTAHEHITKEMAGAYYDSHVKGNKDWKGVTREQYINFATASGNKAMKIGGKMRRSANERMNMRAIQSSETANKALSDWKKFHSGSNNGANNATNTPVTNNNNNNNNPNNFSQNTPNKNSGNNDAYKNHYGSASARPVQININIDKLANFDKTTIASSAEEQDLMKELEGRISQTVYAIFTEAANHANHIMDNSMA